MQIIVHSSGRPREQPTVEALLSAGRKPILLVQHSERQIYGQKWGGRVEVRTLPKAITTLSPTRQWIMDNAITDKVVMMDDDLRFFKRRTDDTTKFKQAGPTNIARMLSAIEDGLNRHAHVGICAREGGNRMTCDGVATRMMRVLAYRRSAVKKAKARFDRLPTKQDFDMTLQLLRAGLPNLVLHRWCHDQGGSQAAGGCSVYRTPAMMEESAHALAALHPGLVTVVTKETKQAWGGGERVDVRIAWKKALAEGLANAR